MNYASLVINARRGADDNAGRKFSNLDMGWYIDRAAKFIQGEIGVLENRTSFSLVANQAEYTPSVLMQKPRELELFDSGGPHKVESLPLDRLRQRTQRPTRATIPHAYSWLEQERLIRFGPTPDTSADATTLTGNHTAVATTLIVASTSSFYTEGRVIVGSEVIGYTGKTDTTLTGCTRGMEGTTAATHSDTDAVTERDVLVWGQRLWQDREMSRMYSAGTALFSNADATVAGTSTEWTYNASVGDYIGKTTNATEVDVVKWYKIASITNDTGLELTENYAEKTDAAAGVYLISSPNPFPNYMDDVITSFAVSKMLEKMGNFEGSARAWAYVERFLETAKKNRRRDDDNNVPDSFGARGMSRMPAWLGDQRVQ